MKSEMRNGRVLTASTEQVPSDFGIRPSFGFRPSDFGFLFRPSTFGLRIFDVTLYLCNLVPQLTNMLAQLSTIKSRLSIVDSDSDALLTNAIKAVSARFD